jgi:hypothetical protein
VPNSIPSKQNEDRSLRMLTAQRKLYSRAKVVNGVQFTLNVFGVVIFASAANYWPDWKLYGALWGMFGSLSDVRLNHLARSFKRRAAMIQELFDCYVLEMEWPSIKGDQPRWDEVESASEAYAAKFGSYAALKDWYCKDIGNLPLYLGRLSCQSESCSWDAKLRTRYANILLVAITVFCFATAIVGIISGIAMDRWFLSFVAPCLPLVLFGIRQWIEQRDSVARLENIQKVLGQTTAEALARTSLPEVYSVRSRLIQNEILDHRKSAPTIYDWIYNRMRGRHEKEMRWSAEEFIRRANEQGF